MSENGWGWIGVDLDGTLAEYSTWKGIEHIGPPIPAMVDRVKTWLAEGKDVRIMTARVSPLYLPNSTIEQRGEAQEACRIIQAWSLAHIGAALPVTSVKDFAMLVLYDDRAVQVESNTGRLIVVADQNSS